MLKLFSRNLYVKARKDTDAELRIKGTPISGLVTDVKKTQQGYLVYCSPVEGDNYSDHVFVSKPLVGMPGIRIGGTVTIYVDEFDCDGQYFVDVPLKGEI